MSLPGTGPTTYDDLVARIVDDGIEAARRDYGEGQKLDGSVAGFEACRGKTPDQLASILDEARRDTQEAYIRAHSGDSDDYWYWRCRELEVEWVCNVISAAQMNAGQPTIIVPTARGVMKAAEILGVAAA